jgi:hypothetical protein
VGTQLLLKADKTAIAPGVGTKITWNADGIIVAGAAATTADISDVVDKRYVTDGQRTSLAGLSGSNTGDQDLSPYALAADLVTTNANVAAISASLSSFALASDLEDTNENLAAFNASMTNYALDSDLQATNANVAALSTDLATNHSLTATNLK